MKVRSVAFYKPMETAAFEVGAHLRFDQEETANTVTSIEVSLFGKVTIRISDGSSIVFRGVPFSYIK